MDAKTQSAARGGHGWIGQAVFLGAAALCLTPWVSTGAALGLGIALALTLGNPFARAGRTTAKWLLQACVVLLGFSMNLGMALRAGSHGLVLGACTILATFVLGGFAARRLRIPRRASTLICAGTAICGGSAIAAVGSVVGAAEEEMTVAMGAVFLLNAAALYLFPVIGHALGLSQQQFGTWAGMAIQDISSVVGAAAAYGAPALQTATAVKLSRALWIVPVAFAAAALFRQARPECATGPSFGFTPERRPRGVQVPWFIGLFLLASVARTFVPGVSGVSAVTGHVAGAGFTLTLFLIGAGISRATLKAVGWKPMAQGTLLWVALSVASLLVILLVP
jgi:uncharacterized integral membrane protein (TIGR00698 family)